MSETMENTEGLENPEIKADGVSNQERLFTQEEVNKIVSERLSRERQRETKTKEEQTSQTDTESIKSNIPHWMGNQEVLSKADKLLIEKLGLASEDGSVDGLELSTVRAKMLEDEIENGSLKPLNDAGKTSSKNSRADSVMRKIFGLPERKRG